MQPKIALLFTCTWLSLVGISPAAEFAPANAAAIDKLLTSSVDKARFPGAVLWLEQSGRAYTRAYGSRSILPNRQPMAKTTAFDVASLTKVIATAPSIMILSERGQFDLDAKVGDYLREFRGGLRDEVTIEHLLTHTSGLAPTIKRDPPWAGNQKGIALATAARPESKPGGAFRYSDINFILLGEIVRRVSGKSIDQFAREEIFLPLRMHDTGFNPPAKGRSRIAPTEKVGGIVLLGTVHDPTARRMGGVAGHAGLFTTAPDLARFARMLINGGELDGNRVLSAKSVARMTRDQIPRRIRGTKRGYGWDISTGFSNPKGEHFGSRSYGHTGWTGTSIWLDPARKAFVILLTNRNHSYERRSIADIQWQLGTLAGEAVGAK